MKTLRLIAVLLVFVMMVGVFGVSCNKNDDNTPPVNKLPDDGKGYDENGYELDDLPEDLDFKQDTITILHWQEGNCPEFGEKLTGETISDAVYKRNAYVESRLNVKLNFVPTEGNNKNMDAYIGKVRSDIMSAIPEYDIFASYSMCGASMAMEGYLYDLTKTPYMNFEKPWWPENLIGQATIDDSLYFCSGDISTNTLYYMFVTFFNPKLIEENHLDDPYDLVENGKWTYDKMIEMTKGFYADTNNNRERDMEDQFGLTVIAAWSDAFFFASGLSTIEQNRNGSLVVSDTWLSNKSHELLTDLCNYFNTGDGFLHSSDSAGQRASFADSRSIFTIDSAGTAKDHFSRSGVDYGVVPVPKYDEDQENYYTTLGFTYSMYSISGATQLKDEASAVIEALASEAYRITTPAVFEIAFKYKYSDSARNIPMWDIIKNSISFDLGRVFTRPMKNTTYLLFRETLVNNEAGSWYHNYGEQESVIYECMDEIMAAFKEQKNP